MDDEVVYGDNHRGKKPSTCRLGKNYKENLEKDSPYILLLLTRDQGLHSIRHEGPQRPMLELCFFAIFRNFSGITCLGCKAGRLTVRRD